MHGERSVMGLLVLQSSSFTHVFELATIVATVDCLEERRSKTASNTDTRADLFFFQSSLLGYIKVIWLEMN